MSSIKGVIFDYGGTLDTDSLHWSEVIWQGYQAAGVKVSKETFRMAYVHGERSLAKFPLIRPDHNFLDLLRIKMDVQTSFLVDAGLWLEMNGSENWRKATSEQIARFCYDYVLRNLKKSRPVVKTLAAIYPLVLVSNFYGNIETILNDFQLEYFSQVVESAVVGVRKPDPRIFSLGVEALGLKADEVAVVGDSFDKDIFPAHTIGCHTVWLKGKSWNEREETDTSAADAIIHTIIDLPAAIQSLS